MTAALVSQINSELADLIIAAELNYAEITITVTAGKLLALCQRLRDDAAFQFDILIDVCGVDYLHYGKAEWETDEATSSGFSRGVKLTPEADVTYHDQNRFAVVYHLLSTKYNSRLRIRCFTIGEPPQVDSVHEIWNSANWFEREAFDLYGILFNGHPDLRRILTDYGFVGHPFRKDFPISGNVEMRYDASLGRVVYGPVEIPPRVLVPKVIREDNRYIAPAVTEKVHG